VRAVSSSKTDVLYFKVKEKAALMVIYFRGMQTAEFYVNIIALQTYNIGEVFPVLSF
jgi:hypothetical protein